VVGHGVEVERTAGNGHVEAGRVFDRLTFCEAIGVVGRAAHIEDIGVETVARVDVHVAEIGVALCIVARRSAFRGCALRRCSLLGRRGFILVSAAGDKRKRG